MIVRCLVRLPLDFDSRSDKERQLFFDQLWCVRASPEPILDLEPPEYKAELLKVAVLGVAISESRVEVSYGVSFTRFRACEDRQCDWTLTRSVRGTRTGNDVLFESYRATETSDWSGTR